jgi:uncharacterized protein YjbJ (UPF0337 family)
MNNDQVKGRVKEIDGKAKEVAGKVVGNRDLAQKSKVQNSVGKIQSAYGDLKNDLKKGA